MNKRIVIIGGGFAGINLAKKLANKKEAEVVLVDRNNYNYFPPLIYQVASSFIEPSIISYPFRKMFQGKENIRFYQGSFLRVDTQQNTVYTSEGKLQYDYLVFAHGTQPNYFGLQTLREKSLPLKSISDALKIRNTILNNMEQACKTSDAEKRRKLMTFVIAGGGPTGVELSGMLSEMNRNIRKKDYPELVNDPMYIYLIDAAPALLRTMSQKSQQATFSALARLGVHIRLSVAVQDFKDDVVYLSNGEQISTKTLIWVSGVIANEVDGLPQHSVLINRRILVDEFNRVSGTANIFAIGDVCYQDTDPVFPYGHPQVAQVAMQQGTLLGKNFIKMINGTAPRPFRYKDKGSMAIINKYKAVAELPVGFFSGFTAWLLWLVVHILPIAGFKNKIKLVFSWMWNFISNDPTLRLMITNPVQQQEKQLSRVKVLDSNK